MKTKKIKVTLLVVSMILTAVLPLTAVTAAGFTPDPVPSNSTPISNRMELAAFIALDPWGAFHLVNDIDLDGQPWLPITNFDGTFCGQGFVVSNMLITGDHANYGLFGELGDYAVIKNVGVTGSINVSLPGRTNKLSAGGIAAQGGTIINCFSGVDINISVGADWGVNAGVGGISGRNSTVERSYNTGNINIEAGDIAIVGGIIGEYGTVTDSFNRGNISGGGTSANVGGISGAHGVVIRSYNTGNVSATGWSGFDPGRGIYFNNGIVGAITGYIGGWGGIDDGITNSFWNIDSDQNSNGPRRNEDKVAIGHLSDDGRDNHITAVLSLTSEQMREQSSFAGWDFNNVWTFREGQNDGFPVLQSAGIFPHIVTLCDSHCDWGEWHITTEMTCESPGVISRNCNNCLASEREAVMPECDWDDFGWCMMCYNQIPPCIDCNEYPCVCPPPCIDCNEYPCVCPPPCIDCNEYPCVCPAEAVPDESETILEPAQEVIRQRDRDRNRNINHDDDNNFIIFIIIGAGVLLVTGVIILIIALKKKSKKLNNG